MRSAAAGACCPVDSTGGIEVVGTLFAVCNLLLSGAEEGCKPAGPSFWRAGEASLGSVAEPGATKSSVKGGTGLAAEPGFGRASSGVNFFGGPGLSVGMSVGGLRCGRIGSGLGAPMSAPGLGNTCCCHGMTSVPGAGPGAGSDTEPIGGENGRAGGTPFAVIPAGEVSRDESSTADGRPVGGQGAVSAGTVPGGAVPGGITHH